MVDLSESMWSFALQPLRTSYSTTAMLMTTKLSRMVTYHKGHPPFSSHDPSITPPCKITWQTKNISTTRVPMAIKLGRTATYLDGLLPITSHDSLITWSCKITWKTKNVFPQLENLWPPILAGWGIFLMGSCL